MSSVVGIPFLSDSSGRTVDTNSRRRSMNAAPDDSPMYLMKPLGSCNIRPFQVFSCSSSSGVAIVAGEPAVSHVDLAHFDRSDRRLFSDGTASSKHL